MKHKLARVGDILELRIDGLFAYLQYIGRHPEFGDAILVSSKLHDRKVLADDVSFADAYVTFYPVAVAISQDAIDIVGHAQSPGLPKRFRRPGAISGNRVKTWILEDECGMQVKARLTSQELQLPIAEIWNHALLIQRVLEGWHPSDQEYEL